MIQVLLVAVIVAAAVAYSAWVLMPAAWRRGAAAHLARRAAASGVARERAAALQARLEDAAACGECASCKRCAGPPPTNR